VGDKGFQLFVVDLIVKMVCKDNEKMMSGSSHPSAEPQNEIKVIESY